ncbi:MAG: YbjN domain-containing protein [Spirochaetaceae bacterium]|nr:YbjN domain-containing protein [Spirochaetaceae bacterium]
MEPPDAAEIIPENDVTPENILALFKRAFYSASLDDDGDVCVDTDGPRVYVTVMENTKLLRYTTVYGVNDTAPLESKHTFVNKMNDDVILCRFSIPEHDHGILYVDYFLPFGEGVLAFQIVSALRWFARIVPSAIRDCDDGNFVI